MSNGRPTATVKCKLQPSFMPSHFISSRPQGTSPGTLKLAIAVIVRFLAAFCPIFRTASEIPFTSMC